MKLQQGNVFTLVCHFPHGRGVSASGPGGFLPLVPEGAVRHTPGKAPYRQTPPGQTPSGQTPPLGRHLPRADTPLHSACWNTHTHPLHSACCNTVNKRIVRIILKCILINIILDVVYFNNQAKKGKSAGVDLTTVTEITKNYYLVKRIFIIYSNS